MEPLHQGRGCRQYATVMRPRNLSRMRRTVRPMPASPDASRGLISTTAAPASLAIRVVLVTLSSDGGSGAANTSTASSSSKILRSLADAMTKGASGHRAWSIAVQPASGKMALTLTSGPMRLHSCAVYSRVISHTLSWSPASAMTLPEMGSQSSGMRSSTRLPSEPLEMASSVAAAAVATASKRLSGSSSSSNFWVPSSLARPRIWSAGGAASASGSAAEAEDPSASSAVEGIFWNLEAARRVGDLEERPAAPKRAEDAKLSGAAAAVAPEDVILATAPACGFARRNDAAAAEGLAVKAGVKDVEAIVPIVRRARTRNRTGGATGRHAEACLVLE
mmetsp:Transcript_40926/g.65615  ORF Transcript_40926/g.65615 Transcript_40926/m.65615 type:complete len:335 (-) Transcript_40926:9-1013(-)